MPELDLGALSSRDLFDDHYNREAVIFAGFRLLAVMTWPLDDTMRKQFLVTMDAASIDKLKSVRPQDSKKEDELLESINKNGGFGALAHSPAMSIMGRKQDKEMDRGEYAGHILRIMVTLDTFHRGLRGGASVNKAMHALKTFRISGPKSRKEIRRAWSDFKSVAHLYAAFLTMNQWPEITKASERREITDAKLIVFFTSWLGSLLSVAKQYEQFLVSFTPHGQADPLVPPGDAWRIPSGIELPAIRLQRRPLPPEILEAVQSYRAPIPLQ